MGKMIEKKYTLPESEYYSDEFRRLWDEMLEKYSFRDSETERTVRNYGSTVKLICDHAKKDFLELMGDDAVSFFEMLDERVKRADLKGSTAFTYKKNLRSVGNYLERMPQSKGKKAYASPFTGLVFDRNAGNRFASRKQNEGKECEEAKTEAAKILSSIKRSEREQYYYIFCMLAYFGELTPVKICDMKRRQLGFEDGKAVFSFEINRQRPKTELPGRELSKLQQETHNVRYRLPEEAEKGFCEFYPEYIRRVGDRIGKEPEYVFYNRNYCPINFKTLSTTIKKHITKCGTQRIKHIRDLCGILSE